MGDVGRWPSQAEWQMDRAQECAAAAAVHIEIASPAAHVDPTSRDAHVFASPADERIGDFRLLREIGRGGMGVVYEAEQVSLARKVALKTLPAASALDDRQLQRFRNEARSVAVLDHPNIVSVYAVGCNEGVHYYAMQYIPGQTLASLIDALRCENDADRKGPGDDLWLRATRTIAGASPAVRADISQPHRQPAGDGVDKVQPTGHNNSASRRLFVQTAVRLGIQAADALDHAHRMGVVHRDVKPSNLMVNANGHLWVTDFGLAQIETEVGLTRTGHLLGTIPYMSPEQARGQRTPVDGRADIYSLGVTLYELLTLEPAFGPGEPADVLRRVLHGEVPRPRQVNPAIPRDLETIILKAIARDRADRYQSADALADDLRNFAEHRPIVAKRPGVLDRLARWSRRRSGLVATTALLLAVTSIAFFVSTLLVARAHSQMAGALEVAEIHSREARKYARTAAELLYVSDIRLAAEAISDQDWRQASLILSRYEEPSGGIDLRGFEWHYLHQLGQADHATIASTGCPQYFVCHSPDGSLIAAAGGDAVVRFFDSRTCEERLQIPTGQREVNGLAFSPDRRTLATAGDDGTVRLWDLRSNREILRIKSHDGLVYQVAFAIDGRVLVSCGNEPHVRLWDPNTEEPLGLLVGPKDTIDAIAVSPDGRRLLAGSIDRRTVVWDIASARIELDFTEESKVACVAYSRDGSLFAAGTGDGFLHVRHADGRVAGKFLSPDFIQAAAFSPDGQAVFTADRGGAIRNWRLPRQPMASAQEESCPPCHAWPAHDDRAMSLAVSSDGWGVVSAGWDGQVYLWHIGKPSVRGRIGYFDDPAVALVSRRSMLATCGTRGEILLWKLSPLFSALDGSGPSMTEQPDASSGEEPVCLAEGVWREIAASDDGQLVAAGNDEGAVAIWNLGSRERVANWRFSQSISLLHFSRDGSLLAVKCSDADDRRRDIVRILEVAGRAEPLVAVPVPMCNGLGFTPDARRLLAPSGDDVLILDVRTGRAERVLHGGRGTTHPFALSFDGRVAAAVQSDRQIIVWDVRSGQQRFILSGHRDRISAMAFAPDGRSLVTGDEHGVVKVWNLATGQEVCQLGDDLGSCRMLTFWADGRRLVCHHDGSLALFDWRPAGERGVR